FPGVFSLTSFFFTRNDPRNYTKSTRIAAHNLNLGDNMNILRLFRVPTGALFVLVCLIASLTQSQRQLTPQEQDLADYIKNNYTKREVMIPTRDRVKLFTAIYAPKDTSQKYPILLNRTPYTVSPYGPEKFKTQIGPNELFPREGYIFVYQD